jgi:hypothetical protein
MESLPCIECCFAEVTQNQNSDNQNMKISFEIVNMTRADFLSDLPLEVCVGTHESPFSRA